MTACTISYNDLPHINDISRMGIRSVRRDLPDPPTGTMWSLKHRHFYMDEDEILLFEVFDDKLTTCVISREEAKGMYPCQAIYSNGHWEIVGVTRSPCDMKYPDIEGSGMITANLKKGQLVEMTNGRKRIQVFKIHEDKVVDGYIDNARVIITSWADQALGCCVKCLDNKDGNTECHDDLL